MSVVAQREGLIQTGRETLARTEGFEPSQRDRRGRRHPAGGRQGRGDARRAAFSRGRMPVVLANGFGGVLFHEACGHGLEADFILKKTSIWEGRRGQRVAEPFVTALDDGVTAGMWGSAAFDDEGTPFRAHRGGRGRGAHGLSLTDLSAGRRSWGWPSTGNGRRQSFRHLPYPRMTNTYFAPGHGARRLISSPTPRGPSTRRACPAARWTPPRAISSSGSPRAT